MLHFNASRAAILRKSEWATASLSPHADRSTPCDVLGAGNLPPLADRQRIVLLQGPVGPFFRHLQRYLETLGFDAWRIVFNPGDRLFSGRRKVVGYRGGRNAWSGWLRAFLISSRPDCIVMFGSERLAHKEARRLADELGIDVVSLEEGYLRAGYVTVERGANNWLSPRAGRLPEDDFSGESGDRASQRVYSGFPAMCAYGAVYYFARTLFSGPNQRQLFHRPVRPLAEAVGWPRNLWRRVVHASANWSATEKLLEHFDKRYFLVPLQVRFDTQMGEAALGWTGERLVRETLSSFSRAAPATHRLVFKIHPLERGDNRARALITALAAKRGIGKRVDVVDAGSLGLLTRHAAGVITINSSSGFSALHHGVPLLVVGRAFYENEALATCARGKPDFDTFWNGGHVADARLRRRYLAWVEKNCLKPGDFYATEAVQTTCAGVVEAIRFVQEDRQTADQIGPMAKVA